jgi:hypothetical protein
MISKRARVAIGLAAGALMVAVTAAAQTDPFVGTWTLNLAKSKYTPGPAPKSTTAIYEAAGKGYKITVKVEPASAASQEWSYTTNLDGKESTVTGNNPNADSVAVKRIDAHTLEAIARKGGKITTTQQNVVAHDGKTRTVTTTGTDAQGQKIHNVAVYDKK